MAIVAQYPFIDENGNERDNLIKHYSDQNFYIIQNETGLEYTEAVDLYPCKYTYSEKEGALIEISEEPGNAEQPLPGM